MERLPLGRHRARGSRRATTSRRGATDQGRNRGTGPLTSWGRLATVTGALMLAGVAVPAGTASAAPATRAAPAARASGSPTLDALIARVNQLSSEMDSLSQQYDGLRIQLVQARREAAIAREIVKRDQKLLASGQAAIGQIAAQGYMSGNLNPTLQLLQTGSPQRYLNQASIMLQLQRENGDKISLVAAAEAAAQRAQAAAIQAQQRARTLSATMKAKVKAIQARQNVLDSAAYAQAMSIFRQTGTYPNVPVAGNSIGVRALRYALSKRGDPYVWGGAGPSVFDCSGLVMWAYAQVGIALPHFTGSLWNSGQHVSRSELQPGDLVFFFAGLDHVGIYMGNGLMVDAPTFGQPVQVQPVYWSAYDGAVRIA